MLLYSAAYAPHTAIPLYVISTISHFRRVAAIRITYFIKMMCFFFLCNRAESPSAISILLKHDTYIIGALCTLNVRDNNIIELRVL